MFGWSETRAFCVALICVIFTLGSPASSATKATNDIQVLPSPSAKPKRSKDAPFVIVAFGSSSTQGAGASKPAFTYPARTERLFLQSFGARPGVVVLNRGVGGEDIDDMLKRLDRDVLARKPDLVIWQAGSNDILRDVPVDRFREKLSAGIAAIRIAGADVILIEPQWCPSFAATAKTLKYVNAMRSVAADLHIPNVRRYDLMRQWVDTGLVRATELVGRDGLHMTDRGYELLAKAVFAQVEHDSTRFRARFATLGSPPM